MTDFFILKLNIERYRDLLTNEKDELKRHMLEKLLSDAEVELKDQRHLSDDKSRR